jgi:hypothetical protein
MTITWEGKVDRISGVMIELSVDAGKRWAILTPVAITPAAQSWGAYPWTVPATIAVDTGNVATVTANGLIKVREYFNTTISDVSDAKFAITADAPAERNGPWRVCPGPVGWSLLRMANGSAAIRIETAGDYAVALVGLDGERIVQFRGRGPACHILDTGVLARGVYVLESRGTRVGRIAAF